MGAPEGPVALWDAASGRLLRLVRCFADPLNALAFSPDGSRFLGCNWGADVCIWDARTGEPAREVTPGLDGDPPSQDASPSATQIPIQETHP